MRLVQFITAWANAPFTIAFGIAAGVAVLQASGVLSLLGDHDADVDGDADLDGDAEVDGGAEADGDNDAEHSFSGIKTGLGLLGFGRIPFSLAWQTGAIAFALTGLLLNAGYIGRGDSPPIHTLLWTVPAGVVAALGSIAGIARLLGPLFTPEEATTRAALVGREGVVISTRVTLDFGEVRIRDDHGHDLRVICRLAPGNDSVAEGKHVVVVDIEDGGKPVVAPV